MDTHASARRWQVIAILVARLIFGGFFAMAAIFKFADFPEGIPARTAKRIDSGECTHNAVSVEGGLLA